MNEVLLLCCWLAYFYLHSLLAANSVKFFFTRLFSIPSPRVYRVAYNLFFFAGLIVLLCLQFFIPSSLLFQTGIVTEIASFAVMVSGMVIMLAAIRNYDWKSFIGITNLKEHTLVIEGMNKYVRHPLYSGTILFVAGYFLFQPYSKNLLLLVLMFIYLAVGILYEEKKLVNVYGIKYEEYQRRVKKMIPFVW